MDSKQSVFSYPQSRWWNFAHIVEFFACQVSKLKAERQKHWGSEGGKKTQEKTRASRPSLASTLFLQLRKPSTHLFLRWKKDAEVKIEHAGDKGRGHPSNPVKSFAQKLKSLHGCPIGCHFIWIYSLQHICFWLLCIPCTPIKVDGDHHNKPRPAPHKQVTMLQKARL